MAKQRGIIALRGKIKGQSYYGSKVGGDLVRTINEGMSARVKTGKEYANTRKNNAEFGASGAFAGLVMRTIPKKFRYILLSTATGLLNKEMKKQLTLDSGNLWGERQVQSGGQIVLQDYFNTLSKNQFPEDIKTFIVNNMKYDGGAEKIFNDGSLKVSASMAEYLYAIGADYFSIYMYALNVSTPSFSHTVKSYATPEAKFQELEAYSITNKSAAFETEIYEDEVTNCLHNVINDDSSAVCGVFAVFTPLRKVGSGYNTLQQHCSAAWIGIKEGTAPEP